MSTHWDLYCVTCKDSAKNTPARIWVNHGEDAVRELIRAAPQLLALADALQAFDDATTDWRLQLDGRFDALGENKPYVSDLATWFRAHVGHDVRPMDEYGRTDDQCQKNWTCTACDHPHKCGKALGHDGACGAGGLP